MAERKGDIRQQFGLDYLIKGGSRKEESTSQQSVESQSEKEIQTVLAAVGGKVLEILKKSPDKSAHLFDIVEKTDINLPTLFRVVHRLESIGLVQRLEEDKFGNHKIRLTEIGETTLS